MSLYGLDLLRLIPPGGQGCKTALGLLLDGEMSAINVANPVLGRSCPLLWGGREIGALGQHRAYVLREAFDVRRILHPPRMTMPLLPVLLGFSIAIQRPLCTLGGGSVRMDGRPKERGEGGRTVPTTIRMTAVMFWDADDVIAKNCRTIGGCIRMALSEAPTCGCLKP